jgi:GNAT superfamily N-acetyltransferase
MQETTFRIRQAGPADATRLHELHTMSVRTLCRGHYSPDVIDGWLLNRRPEGYLKPLERGDIFVVERGADVIGFGEAVRGVIIAVYVDPGAVMIGVGSAIMRHALEVARRDHNGPIRLESTLNAVLFYERFGFREVERSSVARGNVTVPVIVMERYDT